MTITSIVVDDPDPDLWAYRLVLKHHDAHRPPWWRVFARANWRRNRDQIEDQIYEYRLGRMFAK